MKLIKMLGLAAVAATAIMAFTGAGTASAASGVLCEELASPCPAGKILPKNSEIKFHLQENTKALFTTPPEVEILVECNESQIHGVETKENPVEGEITTTSIVTFTNNGGNCPGMGTTWEVEVLNRPYKVWTTQGAAPGEGEFHAESLVAGKFIEFKLKQGTTLECRYRPHANPMQGTASIEEIGGKKHQRVSFNTNFDLIAGSLLCRNPGIFRASYQLWAERESGKSGQVQVFLI